MTARSATGPTPAAGEPAFSVRATRARGARNVPTTATRRSPTVSSRRPLHARATATCARTITAAAPGYASTRTTPRPVTTASSATGPTPAAEACAISTPAIHVLAARSARPHATR